MLYTTPQLMLIGETAGVVLGSKQRVPVPTDDFVLQPPANVLYYDDLGSLESEW